MSANIAAANGIEPCPMCGSDQVRWRRRRWYDAVRTQTRWFVETMLHAVTGGGRTIATARGRLLHPEVYLAEERFLRSKAAYDSRVSSATPVRFWKCRACRREGHEFDNTESILDARSAAAEREDILRARGGMVVHPVDRDGMERDR